MSAFDLLQGRDDLGEVAGRRTELRPWGEDGVDHCPHPDHEDENPSLHFYPDIRQGDG